MRAEIQPRLNVVRQPAGAEAVLTRSARRVIEHENRQRRLDTPCAVLPSGRRIECESRRALHYTLRKRDLPLKPWAIGFLIGIGVATTLFWPPIIEFLIGGWGGTTSTSRPRFADRIEPGQNLSGCPVVRS
jgi:hypothetical protein